MFLLRCRLGRRGWVRTVVDQSARCLVWSKMWKAYVEHTINAAELYDSQNIEGEQCRFAIRLSEESSEPLNSTGLSGRYLLFSSRTE